MTTLSAGIIVIGNEILSGRTQDTNSNFIAKNLIESGINLEKIIVIQDIEIIIIDNVIGFSEKYSYVFTTGGIGPTHDDITSESISKAFKLKYEFHPEAFNLLKNFYPKGKFNEGRQKMAKMPFGAELIYNPVLEKIKKGSPKKIITINTDLYESTIALLLSDIQNKYIESSIGSYPYFNFATKNAGVNIVVSSWTMDSLDEIVSEIQSMITLKGGKSLIV